MITGNCICAKVSYIYDGEINEIAMCHCSQCRKAQGGAFATNSPVNANKLRFSGVEFIKEFQSNHDKVRAFCSNCGSPLYSALKSLPDIKRLRLGTVATAFQCDKKYHIFCDSKASWYSIFDEHHQYKENKTV